MKEHTGNSIPMTASQQETFEQAYDAFLDRCIEIPYNERPESEIQWLEERACILHGELTKRNITIQFVNQTKNEDV